MIGFIKHILWVLSVIALVLLIGVVVAAILLYTRPLGPEMTLVIQEQSRLTQTALPKPVILSPSRTPPSDRSYCGKSGVMHLVVIGRASPNTVGMYGADAVRLVIVNFDAPSAAVLALPAELWVNTPVLSGQGIDHLQLNLVYQAVWDQGVGNPDNVRTVKATQALAQTIYDNFGWVADKYVTVEDSPYIKFINSIGGVDLTLAQAVDGTSEGYGVYPAGLNHLDGLRTLNFTRLIHPSGQPDPDWWGSLTRQDLVLHGMLTALLKWENLPNLADVVKTFRKAITTDLSVDQALNLACMVQSQGQFARMETVGPPPHLVTIGPDGHMLPDVNGIIALLAQMEGGN